MKYTQQRYRVNWREYEAGPRTRGHLTPRFSEEAIEAGSTVRLVYGLALRQTEGFLQSLSMLLNLGLRIPGHTTISRRSKSLDVRIPLSVDDGPLHVMIDSTGLRVESGNISGSILPKRRARRKLPIVVNAGTGEILASALTTHGGGYAAQVPVLLTQIEDPLASAMADGAYGRSSVYAALGCTMLNRMTQLMPDGYCIA